MVKCGLGKVLVVRCVVGVGTELEVELLCRDLKFGMFVVGGLDGFAVLETESLVLGVDRLGLARVVEEHMECCSLATIFRGYQSLY